MNRLILALALALSGCATTQTAPQVVDTYCLSARKIIWSIEDSAETIRRAVVHNRAIDRRCGIPGQKA
jgi:uncharacterized lipoprotein YmbA